MRHLAEIDVISDRISDDTTIQAFGHLLGRRISAKGSSISALDAFKANGMAMNRSEIIDASLIAAPSSTKNAQQEKDPKIHQTKQGSQR